MVACFIPFVIDLPAFLPRPTAPVIFDPRAECLFPPAEKLPLRITPASSVANLP